MDPRLGELLSALGLRPVRPSTPESEPDPTATLGHGPSEKLIAAVRTFDLPAIQRLLQATGDSAPQLDYVSVRQAHLNWTALAAAAVFVRT